MEKVPLWPSWVMSSPQNIPERALAQTRSRHLYLQWPPQWKRRAHSGPCFTSRKNSLSQSSLPPPPSVCTPLCSNSSHRSMWLPWQTEEALLRKIRAKTLTLNSTLVFFFFFPLDFLVFYDLHFSMNSK